MINEIISLIKYIVSIVLNPLNHNVMDVINFLSGLMTPVIAIIAAYIAYQQYITNKRQGNLKLEIESLRTQLDKDRLQLDENKLKFDLYSKRYKVFESVKAMLKKINQDGHIDLIELRDFMFENNESKFLFGHEIHEYLEQIKKHAIDLNHLTEEVNNLDQYPVDTDRRQNKIEEKSKVTSWFTQGYEDIEDKFDKYLNLRNL